MEAKKGLSGKHPKMFLWAWIFQNGEIFWKILDLSGKFGHICGFSTHTAKIVYICQNSKFLNMKTILVSLGITYPNFIILGQKLGSPLKNSFFQKKIWKSPKKLKMAISLPLLVLDQNPLGCKLYLGKGSKPCPNCMDIWQLKFLHLVTPKKNGHLSN